MFEPPRCMDLHKSSPNAAAVLCQAEWRRHLCSVGNPPLLQILADRSSIFELVNIVSYDLKAFQVPLHINDYPAVHEINVEHKREDLPGAMRFFVKEEHRLQLHICLAHALADRYNDLNLRGASDKGVLARIYAYVVNDRTSKEGPALMMLIREWFSPEETRRLVIKSREFPCMV